MQRPTLISIIIDSIVMLRSSISLRGRRGQEECDSVDRRDYIHCKHMFIREMASVIHLSNDQPSFSGL